MSEVKKENGDVKSLLKSTCAGELVCVSVQHTAQQVLEVRNAVW